MCGTKIIVEHRILCGDGILLENKILFAGRSLLASAIPLGSGILLQILQVLRRLARRLENSECNALFANIVMRDKICKRTLKQAKFKLRNFRNFLGFETRLCNLTQDHGGFDARFYGD